MESRNWTSEETKLFCEILVDPVNNFMVTLERKALKKASTREVFESVLEELQTALEEPSFKEKKQEIFILKEKIKKGEQKKQKEIYIFIYKYVCIYI